MYSLADWLSRHPQFGGGQQGLPGNETQQPLPNASAYQNAAPQAAFMGGQFQPRFNMGNLFMNHPQQGMMQGGAMRLPMPNRY